MNSDEGLFTTSQVNLMVKEKTKTLTAQLEVLTKCDDSKSYGEMTLFCNHCQGCKNKKKLSEVKGE